MKTLDARGLPCPEPVVKTHQALEGGEDVTTLVDNLAATENLRRFAASRGCTAEVHAVPEGFAVLLRRGSTPGEDTQSASAPGTQPGPESVSPSRPVLFLTADSLGNGSEELGRLLVRTFLHTISESMVLPSSIILMNSAVNLSVEGSPVLEDLRALAARGVSVLSCGTCLKHFDLVERLAVGQVSNMYEISELLLGAPRVIRI